ncbi:MAG: hypothetical protein LBB20_00995, partial [Puniceicoccales bacterium]|nr:hypothetical protein [Puniceicoccales bacterium]
VKAEIKDITTDANTPITDLKGLATFFDSTTPLDPWGAPWKFSYADKSDKNVIGPTLKVESSNGDKGNYTFVNGKITVDIIPKA